MEGQAERLLLRWEVELRDLQVESQLRGIGVAEPARHVEEHSLLEAFVLRRQVADRECRRRSDELPIAGRHRHA